MEPPASYEESMYYLDVAVTSQLDPVDVHPYVATLHALQSDGVHPLSMHPVGAQNDEHTWSASFTKGRRMVKTIMNKKGDFIFI